MLNIQTLVLGNYATNCYIVYDPERTDCVVIDPGYEPEQILSRLNSLGKSLAAIMLTHGHFDHVGAVKALFEQTDCDVYLCPEDRVLPEGLTAGPLCYTNSYAEGSVITVAGLTFTVMNTPGHTPGSVCLQCQDVLFTGDTLFCSSCGRTDLGGSWAQMQESLQRLKNLPDNYKILPGHGEATTLQAERIYNPYMR